MSIFYLMVTRPFFIDILVYISKNEAYIRAYQELYGGVKGRVYAK